MKQNNKLAHKFIIGMVLTASFNQAVAVETSGIGFRPSLGLKKEVVQVDNQSDPIVLAQRVAIMQKTLTGLKMNLSKSTIDILSEQMAVNKGLYSGISNIARDQAENVREINQLRVEIASLVADIDVSDASQRSRSDSDLSYQKEFDIAQLVLAINPRGVSSNTRDNLKFFLKKVKGLLESKMPRSEVLTLAAEALHAETGFTVDVESIASSVKTSDGAIALFKGVDETMPYEIGQAGDKPLILRMTAKQLNDMEKEVLERVEELVHLAQDPQNIQKIFANKALKELNTVSDEVTRFTKDNEILNASSRTSVEARQQSKAVSTSIDDLLRELQVLGVTIGGDTFKNSFLDVLRTLPVFGKKIPDRVERLKTAREQIEVIDKALVEGANKMEKNNTQLMKMKAYSISNMVKLQTELARTKMAISLLKQYAEHFQSLGNEQMFNSIEQDILLPLQRSMNASLTLYGNMAIAIASIDAIVSSNEVVIQNANDVRRSGIPAIAIQETLKIANQQTQDVMLQQRAIQSYLKTLTVQNVELLKKNAALMKETMSTPLMEAAVIGQAIRDLVEIQKQSKLDRAEAEKTMDAANNEMIDVVNQINSLHLDSVGTTVNRIFHQK